MTPEARSAVLPELHCNPFYVLGATTRDKPNRIVELADERALIVDPDLCQKARSDLVSPRARLTCELAWLPGVSPRRTSQAVETFGSSLTPEAIDELPPLARANVLCALLQQMRSDPVLITPALARIAHAVSEIDAKDVQRDINEDREIAGIPPVKDLNAVEEELAERLRRYGAVAHDLLDTLQSVDIVTVIADLVQRDMDRNGGYASDFVETIVTSYETAAQGFMEAEAKTVEAAIGRVRTAAATSDARVGAAIEALKPILANWSRITRPIQILQVAKGLDHDASLTLAYSVRSLAIDLNNDHDMPDRAAQLTACLREEFSCLAEFAERVGEDARKLDDIKAAREESRRNAAAYESSLAFSADVGLVAKDRLEISARGVVWKGRTFRLDDITRLRWGGTRQSVNGIPMGTAYEIFIGTPRDSAVIHLRRGETFEGAINSLWRGVGVRLLFDYAEHLRNGGTLTFPGAVVDDHGVTLKRWRMFKGDEPVYVPWNKVRMWTANGCFVLGLAGDDKVKASLSYTEADNVHVLENMLRAFAKNDRPNLSSITE